MRIQMLKYTIEYSDKLDDGCGAKCFYPIMPMLGTCRIVIRPKHKGDEGLLKHEIVHVRQYNKCFFHAFLYMYSTNYRYECELEAYSAQIRAYKYNSINQCEWIVDALYTKYNTKLPRELIMLDIIRILNKETQR